MKKKFWSRFLAAFLCLCVFSGCQQSAGESSLSGASLGMDVDECLKAWGITLEDGVHEDEIQQPRLSLKEPFSYLGADFQVTLEYFENGDEAMDRKLSRITFFRDLGLESETVARETAGILAALEKEYGAPEGDDASSVTEDSIRKAIEEQGEELSLYYQWYSQEEYAKLDKGFTEALEATGSYPFTYYVHSGLSSMGGQFTLVVEHTFSIVKE